MAVYSGAGTHGGSDHQAKVPPHSASSRTPFLSRRWPSFSARVAKLVLCSLCLLSTHCTKLLALMDDNDTPPPVRFQEGEGASIKITSEVVRKASDLPPIGTNGFGAQGAIDYARNNLIVAPGNEPIVFRDMYRVKETDGTWFEIDGGGASWYDLWASGYLSGASVRAYRLVGKSGKPLQANKYGDIDGAAAAEVKYLGEGRVIPSGAPGYPHGGHVVHRWSPVKPNAELTSSTRTATDDLDVKNGTTYLYRVVALGEGEDQVAPSKPVRAVPRAGRDVGPRLQATTNRGLLLEWEPDGWEWRPRVVGGKPPYRFRVFDPRNPRRILRGFQFEEEGTMVAEGDDGERPPHGLGLEVTDAKNRKDRHVYHFVAPPVKSGRLRSPKNLRVEAGNGYVHLAWDADPAGVRRFRVERTTVPENQHYERLYLTQKSPKLRRGDYVVLQKEFLQPQPDFASPRVRPLNEGQRISWPWHVLEGDGVKISLARHDRKLTRAMSDPGRTCLRVEVPEEAVIHQSIMIGTEVDRQERLYYGQLEPGLKYRWEGWVRSKGLDGGAVRLSFADGYPDLKKTILATSEWSRFTWDFVAPDRPEEAWHFGPTLSVQGPGTLWFDNMKIVGYRSRDELERYYVPNSTVHKALVDSQPSDGPKGTHRAWYLDKDATMDSLLSTYANSGLDIDWYMGVGPTADLTMPMGLEFDRLTGAKPETRVRPWLVLQHLLHTEADWHALIEWLAAPYDPKRDSPKRKPYAYRRYRQRGTGVPWTDEFKEIYIELGNETWHNGIDPHWLGFATRSAVHQGGPQYGHFSRYIIEHIKKSTYWKEEGLEGKIQFVLGANYDGQVESDEVIGYGEEAILVNPLAKVLSHANYIGPKWETDDAQLTEFNDRGLQAALLGWIAGPMHSQRKMSRAQAWFQARGQDYQLTAYEGGPSGFRVPGYEESEETELINERYGKSLALAIGTFDGWMGSYELGWTDQNYYTFGQGSRWNSHTIMADGFRPSPAWQALTLRNRVGRGDLVRVKTLSSPGVRFGGRKYPAVGAYAMREGRRWTVFLFSRSLRKTVPVEVQLPFARAASVQLHRLAGNVEDSNLEALKVRPEVRSLDSSVVKGGRLMVGEDTGGDDGGLPPGTLLAFVFETK